MLNIARNIYSAQELKLPKDELPEAEIIPIGESKNEIKKLKTVIKKYPVLKEYENIPLPGFTLLECDRKHYGSADQTWLVIDPRGYLVRISNENLVEILHTTGITEGLIQERCVWARDDTQTKMILVPISSSKYIEAVRNTELIEDKVDIKDVQIGDTVLLQNELQGIYMGVVSLYGMINNYSVRNEYKPQVYLRRQVIEVNPGKYHYRVDAKILKVIKKADKVYTREDSVKQINEHILLGNSYFTPGTDFGIPHHFGHSHTIKHTSIHAVPKVTISFEEIDNLEATSLFYDAQFSADIGMLALENSTGNHLIDFPYSFSSAVCTINSFEILCMKNKIEIIDRIILNDVRKSSYVFTQNSAKVNRGLNDFKKYYRIVKHVKNETYI